MGRSLLPKSQRRAIIERLRRHVKQGHGGNRSAFERSSGIPHATVGGWFSADPVTPDVPQMIWLAEREQLNLNWLLLGEGPELRVDIEESGSGEPDDTLESRLRAVLVSELAARLGVPVTEATRFLPEASQLVGMVAQKLAWDIRLVRDEDYQVRVLDGLRRWLVLDAAFPFLEAGVQLDRLTGTS